MKILSSTIVTILLSIASLTQVNAQILYGLSKTNSSNPFDIVSIDPFTGNSTVLFSTNNLMAVALNATTYDQFNKRYICWGIDNANQSRLYVADIDSGQVVNHPILVSQPIELEYDLKYQKAYGLWYDNAQGLQHFVEVDLSNGTVSTVVTLPNIQYIVLNHATYDSNNSRYFFSGIEYNGQQKLIAIDALNGVVSSSVSLNPAGTGVSALEYNVQNDKLYGISTQTDPNNQMAMRLYELDPATGNSTLVNSNPIISGSFVAYQLGGIAFDQLSQSYIITTINDTSTFIRMIDVTTGITYSSADLANASNGGSFSEIQVDNNSFAKSYFATTNTQSPLRVVEGRIFPNPAENYINVEVAGEMQAITIFDMMGKVVLQDLNPTNTQIDISAVPNGTYLLVVETMDGFFKAKLVK